MMAAKQKIKQLDAVHVSISFLFTLNLVILCRIIGPNRSRGSPLPYNYHAIISSSDIARQGLLSGGSCYLQLGETLYTVITKSINAKFQQVSDRVLLLTTDTYIDGNCSIYIGF